jgi:HSP20 family protein
MADLNKWLPFKFKRSEKKKEQQQGMTPASVSRSMPAPFSNMHERMNQMMSSMFSDDFWRNPFAAFADSDRWFGDFAPATFQPNIDVSEDDKHLKISAELPGLEKDDIDLQVHEGVLTLRGEKKSEKTSEDEGWYRTERYHGSFQRSIPLPADVDHNRAEARFDKGVLTVRLPKTKEATKTRKIDVA